MGKNKGPKFYAVKIGRQPGVFASWAECEAQTKNFSGALHKSFGSKAEAEQFVECGADQIAVPSGTGTLAAEDVLRDNAPPSTAAEPDACAEQPAGHVSHADPAALYHMTFDGGARGNPGPAGAGAALFLDGRQVGSICLSLNRMTNNQAEYFGLIAGLQAASYMGITRLAVKGDSELVIKQVQLHLQVNGVYQVKNQLLRKLYLQVVKLRRQFQVFSISHVLRGENQVADELSNRAMDGQGWSGLRDTQGRVWPQCTPDLSLDIAAEEPVTEPPRKRRRNLAPK